VSVRLSVRHTRVFYQNGYTVTDEQYDDYCDRPADDVILLEYLIYFIALH